MKIFKNLSAEQRLALLKLPVYVSLLATNDYKLDEAERLSIIKLAHTRSFSAEPLLIEFYKEADKELENMIAQVENDLPKQSQKREAAIKNELLKLDQLILILGTEYALAMYHSLKTFKDHVSSAHHSVIGDFVLPVSIPGLTD